MTLLTDVSASVVAEDALNQKETFTPVIETASTATADEMMLFIQLTIHRRQIIKQGAMGTAC